MIFIAFSGDYDLKALSDTHLTGKVGRLALLNVAVRRLLTEGHSVWRWHFCKKDNLLVAESTFIGRHTAIHASVRFPNLHTKY